MGLTERSFLERMELMGFTPTRTNGERIRAMSDEELAKAFVAIAARKRPSTYTAEGFCLDDGEVSETDWLSWLKSPAEPGEVEK